MKKIVFSLVAAFLYTQLVHTAEMTANVHDPLLSPNPKAQVIKKFKTKKALRAGCYALASALQIKTTLFYLSRNGNNNFNNALAYATFSILSGSIAYLLVQELMQDPYKTKKVNL